jgi:DNA-binding LytR/AlgR family response regulator
MARPTLLVAEPEPLQALSVRKLVLETAKFNVITAHSTAEGLELMRQFPGISGAVLVMSREIDCDLIAEEFKKQKRERAVVALTSTAGQRCRQADHHVSGHEPEVLLDLVRSLFGDPRSIDAGGKD